MKPQTAPRIAAALALMICWSAVTPAVAQSAPEDANQKAEALFEEGYAAVEAGDCARAVALLRESQALYAARGTLLNLAHCEAELGQVASAWQHLQDALAILAPDDPRRPLALEQAAALEPKVPRLWIGVAAGSPAPARITVDGVELAPEKLGEELRLDPGERVLEVEWPGGARERKRISLKEGERAVERLAMTQPPSARLAPRQRSAAQPVEKADAGPRSIAPAIAVGGLALVGAGVGVALTVVANNASNESKQLLGEAASRTPQGQHVCPRGDAAACSRLVSMLEKQDRATTIAAVSYGVAGLAAASAVGLLIWARGGTAGRDSAAVAPVVLRGGGGFIAEGRF